MTEDDLLEIYNHEMKEARERGGKNAEDAVQRVFLKLWERRDRYAQVPKETMMKYFQKVKANDIADLRNDDRKWLGEPLDGLDSIDSGNRELSPTRRQKRDIGAIVRNGLEMIRQDEEKIDVEQAKASLNEQDRRMIEQYHDDAPKDRVTLHALGRNEGISPATVQRKIKRAEQTLRERLSSYKETYGSGTRAQLKQGGKSAA